MDFGRLLADPIMAAAVVNSLFFSSRGHGRFSLHSVQCDARAVCPKVIFFHVFWLLTDAILHRRGGLFWTANRLTKTQTFKNGSKRAT